jgi:membrane protein DedA with SNARE-associated domain
MKHHSDGGYKSRKFWFSVGTSLLIVFCGIVAAKMPLFAANLQTIIGGVMGCLAAYIGGNVTAQHVLGKREVALEKPPAPGPHPIEHK